MHLALLASASAFILALSALIVGLRQDASAGRCFKNAGLLFLLWCLPAAVLAGVAASGHAAS